VGATWPEQLHEVRAIVGDLPFLVPGVGAQGGDDEAVVKNARSADGTGLVDSSSRAILYASSADDYATAAATAAQALRDEINRHRLLYWIHNPQITKESDSRRLATTPGFSLFILFNL